MKQAMGRRRFLKSAAQGAVAAPMLASLNNLGFAQTDKPGHMPAAAPCAAEAAPAGPKVTLNVRDYGATGDGKTNDTKALQLTIERCSVLGGGTVVVPAGNYSTGALVLYSDVALHIEEGASLLGTDDLTQYPVSEIRWQGHWSKGYSALISSRDSNNISITGPGRIVGNPAIVGRIQRSTHLRLPALLEFINCRNLRVENCWTSNGGMWSIHPTYCEDVLFKNVVVNSGADGIDVDSCRHVTIDGCTFKTHDDCISLKSGRGEEGFTINRPTEDVHILNCTFYDFVWACIGIGSETSAGVRNARVENCKCVGAGTYAIYIKTRVGRGAFIEDISMDGLDVSGTRLGFLHFNFISSGNHDRFPVPGDVGIPSVRNLRFSNIRVHDVPVLVMATDIDPIKPLTGFSLANVTGTCKRGIFLANIKDAALSDIHITGYSGPLLSIDNVTGTGLGGAAKLEAAMMPKVPSPFPAPATPYRLH